jgi:hypothetical protein
MNIEDEFSLTHLLFKERQCRVCRKIKDLLTDFYVVRKSKKYLPSSYSYECKDCTIKRIMFNRGGKQCFIWEYPDW